MFDSSGKNKYLYTLAKFSIKIISKAIIFWELIPGGSEVKASASNAGDLGSISGSGRSSGEGNGKLEKEMDRGAW